MNHRSAAEQTGLVQHTLRCKSSGLASCVCGYERRLNALADAFRAHSSTKLVGIRFYQEDDEPESPSCASSAPVPV